MWCALPDFYAENLRNVLFTGLLTIGTFVFAVKTFIVVKLKEDVFDTDFYRERLRKQRKLNPAKKFEQFAPLKHLMQALFWASLVSLVSAIMQVTLGLIHSVWSAMICMIFAACAIALLFLAMVLVKINLNLWLEDLEAHHSCKE